MVPRPSRSLFQCWSFPRRCLSTGRPQTIAQLLDWNPETDVRDLVVNGYVRSVRNTKNSQFVDVGDGSTRRHLQAVLPRLQGDGLRIGAAIRLRGAYVKSRGSEQDRELQVEHVDILGPSDAGTYPLQNKYQTAEYLRTLPHLRSRLPMNAALLRLRSEAIALSTQFFASQGFTQTHPPIITSSDCEGAGEVFTVSTDSPETLPTSTINMTLDSFFRSPKYLTVSSQLHLEALAQSVGNVWTLSPTFRAERSDTSRHLSEFYMLEAEMTFVDEMGPVMDFLEDLLRFMTKGLYDTSAAQELRVGSGDEVQQRWEGMIGRSSERWPRITYTVAIDILKSEKHRFKHEPVWGEGLQAEHEKFLASTVGANDDSGGTSPVFVTNYPRDIKAFYMRQSAPTSLRQGRTADHKVATDRVFCETVDCFDLLVPDLCEIAGGSMREHRLDELLRAMELRGMVKPPKPSTSDTGERDHGADLDWYVDLRRWGSPPHGGFGLGFDRLLSYLIGMPSVRDVVAFPRWFGRCDC